MDIEFQQESERYVIVKTEGKIRWTYGIGFGSLTEAFAGLAILERGEAVTGVALAEELARMDAEDDRLDQEQAG